jgi:hypothetical protein
VPTATPTATPTAQPTISAACSNPDGGRCLNRLAAGTYSTKLFMPTLSYTVPDGWQNFEDTPGNFLLVAPGNSFGGVDAGTSEFIGVYTSVRADTRENCQATSFPADSPRTPETMAAEFQSRPGMKVTAPTPVQVGGLQGIVMDLQRDEAWTGDCFRGWLLVGVPPSGLAHGLNDVVVMRLYLLKRGDTTLAIEVNDFADGRHLDAYSRIVDQFEFGP